MAARDEETRRRRMRWREWLQTAYPWICVNARDYDCCVSIRADRVFKLVAMSEDVLDVQILIWYVEQNACILSFLLGQVVYFLREITNTHFGDTIVSSAGISHFSNFLAAGDSITFFQ